MTQLTTHIGRTARRLTLLAVPLLVATTGTAAAMGGGYGGGMMGGGWGLFGGAMGLWGLLWMGLLLAFPLYLIFTLARRNGGGTNERPLSVLRDRYARGELSDDEFERRREQQERTG
ncbi:SHOCT domain-containing protein [Halalkalicoccus sp. NIPERK01]|uniref:SHOCT domain-containing protein n=1 Tax=Halalkalicoccus sp. NIPERK01 TaxID=3053469 RepID=UPI00256F1186|nr:SHOCT domain-containing protein [Halalkalicoccus sp. NIPERK01]MDL5363209.1 SHOCT domain-containing protein [Halalkalicoccus sp. NIPERK01]